MYLQNVFANNSNYQVVLSFSNNNQVLLTEECFKPNSKFMRRSRVRLGVEFYYCSSEGDLDIYRTRRGHDKTDYVVYVNKGDYVLLCSFKSKHTKYIKKTEEKQFSFKDMTAPDREPVVHAYPHANDNEVWVIFKYNSEVLFEEHFPKTYQPRNWLSCYNYYSSIIKCADVLYTNDTLHSGIKEVVFHEGSSEYGNTRVAWNVLRGIYRTHTYWSCRLASEFSKAKDRLQSLGITIRYELSV